MYNTSADLDSHKRAGVQSDCVSHSLQFTRPHLVLRPAHTSSNEAYGDTILSVAQKVVL